MGKYKLKDMISKLRDMISRGRRQPIPTTDNNIHSRKKKQAQVCVSSASTTAHPSKQRQPYLSIPRKSYYFTRDGTPSVEFSDCHVAYENPRKSSRERSRGRTSIRYSSPKGVSSWSCRAKLDYVSTHQSDSPSEYSFSPLDTSPEHEGTDPEIRTDRLLPTESFDELLSSSSSIGYKVSSSAIDKNTHAVKCDNELDCHDTLPELEVELPPIVTKPASAKLSDMVSDVKKKETRAHKTNERRRSVECKETKRQGSLRVKIVKEDKTSTHEQRTGPVRRFSVRSPRARLRIHSPKITSRKIQTRIRNSVSSTGGTDSNDRRNRILSESFPVMKSSFDPPRDFRDSMVEMIVEKNIRASKDLEDLLACYLSHNPDEYHDLIIDVFKQVWFDLIDTI